ncbi:MAG: G5 domain-containing protein [Oscillospiraceae bacterium]|nr:G5 domain-containing protein [Oscillospiraceae bacterium]
MDFIAPFVLRRKNNAIKAIALLLALICLVGSLSQTAQAENTFVITDGDDVTVHTTYASDPATVLKEAGVNLSAEDTYTTESVDGVSEIKVQRLQTITVYYGDEVIETTSYGETLDALFVRLGILIDENMVVSLPLDTQTYSGMAVRADRVLETTESYTMELPYEIGYCDDPTLPVGVEKVLVEGKNGQMLCTANVSYLNGAENSRNVYQQTVTVEPVKQVVARGTGEQVGQTATQPLIGDGFIVLPTGEVLTYIRKDTFLATAYTHMDDGCDEFTANGAPVKWGVVAVDPKVIPYGTRMFIVSNDGAYIYGLSTAEDCGGAIKNKRLDLYMPTLEEAFQFGRRNCTVYFLGDADWKHS